MQVRIVGEGGKELAAGEVGEIVARGPLAMNGYHGRSRVDGGWHATGDLGRREPDGSITFVGPKGRLIKSGFENVYASEVELCIKRHAAVADCAVIGVPDEKWQESVKAIVVLKPGAAATHTDIVEHCRAHIASYKKPRSIEWVDALPRRAGAVDYDALKARFGARG
jgi:long-chain acyl-CoA synthetase